VGSEGDLGIALSLVAIQKPHDGDAFHQAGGRVSEKPASWFEGTVYSYAVIGNHEEVTGLWRMMRRLFRDVIASSFVRIVPIACKRFAEHWVQWFLDTPGGQSAVASFVVGCARDQGGATNVRRFDMPATEIEANDRYEALDGIVDLGHWEQGFGMGHEAWA
jgi:hypothetical protein